MADILILMASHLSLTPRVWREANALSAAGHRVRVAGVVFDDARYAIDQKLVAGRGWELVAAADLRPSTRLRKLAWTYYRARTRLGRVVGRFHVPDPAVLAYAHDRILAAGRKHRGDLTIVHVEVGTWAGAKLLREGHRIGVDLEDWYSENDPTLSFPPSFAAILRKAEREVMRGAVHRTTTSHALARAVAKRYDAPEAEVVYNGTEPVRALTTRAKGPTRFVWFSQTIGWGRGLTELMQALPMLKGEYQVTLVGNSRPQTIADLTEGLPPAERARLHIAPAVPPMQLSAAVAPHDVGLALELPTWPNRDLTASNKIFEYLQGGLSVVASDTSGQKEVAEAMPSAVRVYASGNVARLAAAMQAYIDGADALGATRASISATANALFSTDAQAVTLAASVDRALTPLRARAGGVTV